VTERRYRAIEVARRGAALVLTLSNPARKNAIGPVMANELLWALGDALADDQARAVVLTGAGDVFCAGGDFAQMTAGSDGAEELPIKGDYADLLRAMLAFEKPIVARVNGHAMGGGLGLCAASHFAIATTSAKVGTPEVHVGLFPMMIMAVLTRLVPRRRLVSMMLLGERMSAEEAVGLGLLSRAVAPDELDPAVDALVDELAQKSASTLRLGLRALAAQEDLGLDEALPMLRERLAECLATDDAREGLMAFLEKRPPRWTGK
jgi:enoyl-CoA hydratase/carnithine racemase